MWHWFTLQDLTIAGALTLLALILAWPSLVDLWRRSRRHKWNAVRRAVRKPRDGGRK